MEYEMRINWLKYFMKKYTDSILNNLERYVNLKFY